MRTILLRQNSKRVFVSKKRKKLGGTARYFNPVPVNKIIFYLFDQGGFFGKIN
jgi:hypothetical protein